MVGTERLILKKADENYRYTYWVASENTQTPKFQIFPGQIGIPIPDEMGCGIRCMVNIVYEVNILALHNCI